MADGPSAQGAVQLKESEARTQWDTQVHKESLLYICSQEKMNLESFLNYVAFNKKAGPNTAS